MVIENDAHHVHNAWYDHVSIGSTQSASHNQIQIARNSVISALEYVHRCEFKCSIRLNVEMHETRFFSLFIRDFASDQSTFKI